MPPAPDINHEADRYAQVFDKLTEPRDYEKKLFGRIGQFSVLGMVIYPPILRSVGHAVRLRRLDRAGARYVRAVVANFPYDASLHAGTTLESLRRHAGFFETKSPDINNQEGTI